MEALRAVLLAAAAVAVATGVQGRAVNISNTWVLPEEGFPVFYRYFRDRISWYEADAVCQFHHGNLVTVDTTSQFDAVRAYLKELDIISNVWIGLTRPSDKTEFSWSGEHPLSGEGFWGEAPAAPGVALCSASDPAADFRWHALTCGGPEVASFICELPVPPWATGANGCMLTSLPSLTVIYLPEQTAVELTSDCGLDGTKRIACKGKADHEEMMRQLSCGITHEDFDEKAVSKPPSQSTTQDAASSPSNMGSSSRTTSKTAATKPWIWTSNTIDTSDYGSPTRHRRETEDTFSTAGVASTTDITGRAKHMDTTETTTARPFVYATTRSNFAATATITSSPGPETTRQRPSDKSFEPLTTAKPDAPTSAASDAPGGAGASASTEDVPVPPGEFPSINQGQLFSIIENGTMFDIIEVNDTTGDADEKTTVKNNQATLIDTFVTTRLSTSTEKPLFTTVSYYKEATVKNDGNENKTSPQTQASRVPPPLSLDKSATGTRHSKTANDLTDAQDDKTFMKAIEAFPSDLGSLVKLNRTNRKELPLVDFNSTEEMKLSEDFSLPAKQNATGVFKDIDKDFTITHPASKESQHEHKVVEITITDVDRKTDATKLYVTTKKYDKSRILKKGDKTNAKLIDADNTKNVHVHPSDKTPNNDNNSGKNFTADININIEISEMPPENITEANITVDETVQITIDSKIGDLNAKNTTKNSDSEDITGIILSKSYPGESQSDKTNVNLEGKQVTIEDNGEYDESETKEVEHKEAAKTTEEPMEPIPEAQPRPNRNRILTRPQRRSFYPYFFSRVLG